MTTSEEPWTVGRLLSWTIDYLGKHGADNARLDAEVLLAHARGCRRIDLYTAFGDVANEETRVAFRELVKRRATGTPVAYLVGHREFYSLDFEVNPDVLIPRPDTELMVVALLDLVKGRAAGSSAGVAGEAAPTVAEQLTKSSPDQPAVPGAPPALPITVVDVGTGSGILAVCAAKYLPQATITAIDISPAALAVAKRNAERHKVADRITFVEADLLSKEPAGPRCDYILSNPPYISTTEMKELAVDVRDNEPELALHAGPNGTDVIIPLIEQAVSRLKPGGTLLIEISPMIAAAVEQLVRDQPMLELGPTIKDLAGHSRIIHATRRKAN